MGNQMRSAASSRNANGLFGRFAIGRRPMAEEAPMAADWADHHSVAFLRRYLRAGDCVLDIGGHRGDFAIAAAEGVGPSGRVDCFEPSPTLRAALLERIAHLHLPQVQVYARMAGASTQLGRFIDGGGRDRRHRMPIPGELVSGGVIGVEAVRLDRAVQARHYQLMKIDIGGAELFALRGAEGMLREANPPVLLLAMDRELAEYGTTPDIVANFLADCGYACILYDADRHKLDYVERPWALRRLVLAVAANGLNHLSRRLAGMDSALPPANDSDQGLSPETAAAN